MSLDTDLLQMMRGDITAVVGIKRLRDTTDVPLGHGFTPQCLAQDQGRLDGGWGLKADPKPGNGPAVIIYYDCEPGTSRLPTVMPQPNIQQGVIGLPEVVGLFGCASIEEIIGGSVGFAAVVGQRDQGGVKVLDDPVAL
jgi:hypothetical protein